MRGGEKVYQIRALIDMPHHNVKTGDLGGWIQSFDNLPMNQNGWVSDEAVVGGNTKIKDSSRVEKKAKVFGSTDIQGNSIVKGDVSIEGEMYLKTITKDASGNAVIETKLSKLIIENSEIGTKCIIKGASTISDSKLGGSTKLEGNVVINDSFVITENVVIQGNAYINSSKVRLSHSSISDDVFIHDSIIGNGSRYDRGLTISENASIVNTEISSNGDVWIGENAQLLNGVKISGHKITIKGMAVVKGKVRIGLKMLIDDFAIIDGSKTIPSTGHHSIFGKTLMNDDMITF